MSAALQLPMFWEAGGRQRTAEANRRISKANSAGQYDSEPAAYEAGLATVSAAGPVVSVAFYRRHTERMLRRYLYASMQVGRSPSILGDPVARGWCSSRPIRTFEDAVIFVLDVEKCLNQIGSLDREMLARIVVQEYTQAETASLLGMSVRAVSYKFPQALDRLTDRLLEAGLLVLPE